MVNKCCVPRCTGNYATGEKIHVFKFPKDDKLRNKWIKTIHRETFQISMHSVVCHKHFLDSDILTSTSVVDWKTDKTITVSLDIPRLRTEAVPSLLPNCPTYLSSSQSTSRETPLEKKSRVEAKALEQAIFESAIRATEQNKKFSFSDLNELKSKLEYVTLQNDWHVISKTNCVARYAHASPWFLLEG